MKNKEIREKANTHGIYLWEIADVLGITDSTFSRKLRKELPEAEKMSILKIIDDLKEAANNG